MYKGKMWACPKMLLALLWERKPRQSNLLIIVSAKILQIIECAKLLKLK